MGKSDHKSSKSRRRTSRSSLQNMDPVLLRNKVMNLERQLSAAVMAVASATLPEASLILNWPLRLSDYALPLQYVSEWGGIVGQRAKVVTLAGPSLSPSSSSPSSMSGS